jgi:hypothetical protein
MNSLSGELPVGLLADSRRIPADKSAGITLRDVKFSIGQNVAVTPDAAVAAYGNPAFYENRAPSGDISLVEVVSHEDMGDQARIEVRYKFTGSVSSAVRAVIDPAKISWVTRTDIDKAQRRSSFVVLPDYYPDRLDCKGTFTFGEAGSPAAAPAGAAAAVITIAGDLSVHVFLVGRTVEQLIVTGLRKYLEAEVATLPDFIASA